MGVFSGDCVLSQLTDEQIRLVAFQAELEALTQNEVYRNSSLVDTLFFALVDGQDPRAKKIKNEFDVSDKRCATSGRSVPPSHHSSHSLPIFLPFCVFFFIEGFFSPFLVCLRWWLIRLRAYASIHNFAGIEQMASEKRNPPIPWQVLTRCVCVCVYVCVCVVC